MEGDKTQTKDCFDDDDPTLWWFRFSKMKESFLEFLKSPHSVTGRGVYSMIMQ